ncbi:MULTISPECIES: hypothetical protein [unclassified Flavobacterium]|uniref:hypothetical protein n=1 Tax=unclassified Flavobacterium TaxID=196869 RepID=UPI001F136ADA|nr:MULTISPECIES: hypothetical protein [unclassified Flavobacterium]UMY66509.1 hypothetical protein MKO97_03760 [Flavobacterium sp. HJ-32-4]
MKNLFLSLVATVAISAFAAAQTTFVKMALPKTLQSTSKNFETLTADVTFVYKDGRSVNGKVRLAVPETGLGIVSAEFSKELVDGKIIDSNFFVTYERVFTSDGDGDPDFNYARCIEDCMKTYTAPDGTKLPGRGACKFGCFMNAIGSAVVNAVIPALIKSIVKSIS